MHFNLAKHNTAGIIYKEDGQIPKGKIQDGKIINSNIDFKKSYKLQIRASKMMDGKKTIKKKTVTYPSSTTLLDAIKDASKIYEGMMIEIEDSFIKEATGLYPCMKFSEAFSAYVKYKEEEHKNNSSKKPYNSKGTYAFYNNWLRPIHNTPLNQIRPRDVTALKSKMIGKSDRYKLAIHQAINPIYTFINDNIDEYVKSPAKIKKADRSWDNTREFNMSSNDIKALFKQLKDYPESPFRELFMWLMHGRRRNELLSLQWSDIDLKYNTYTIRAVNNKARVDMTYKLSERLRDTLEILSGMDQMEDMTGHVFRGIQDSTKPLHFHVIRLRWLDLELSIVMHQLRACIVTYLKNEFNVTNEMSGYILGHTQSTSVTERYGTYGYETLNNTLNLMLDDIFNDVKPIDNKLLQLQALFPNKTKEQLEVFLND